MTFKDLKKIYLMEREKSPNDFNFVSKIFSDIKKKYKSEAMRRGKDPNQAWNSWSGHNLQKLITFIVKDFIQNLDENIGITNDNRLSRKKLNEKLDKVRRNVEVFYDKHSVVPDADIIVYNKSDCSVKMIISCKASLRERVAQAAYWKLKLRTSKITKDIKIVLVSTDNDTIFTYKDKDITKSRIIAEYELDGSYIFRDIEESKKVKNFNQIFQDLKKLLLKERIKNDQETN
ncbi:MAG: BsaWI family type II restriction enzyme [bacterium]|nr:BsaWI family type II restriction enzyme [bacterium]